MRLLLDTHVLLWWLAGHPRLSAQGRGLIAHAECHVSAASVWEVAIKHRLGRLPLAPGALVAALREHRLLRLPISDEHAAATAMLPDIHADPFDRLLVAQARLERLTLLTADDEVCAYGEGIRRLV